MACYVKQELTYKCLTSKSMVVDDVFVQQLKFTSQGTEILLLAAYIGPQVQM